MNNGRGSESSFEIGPDFREAGSSEAGSCLSDFPVRALSLSAEVGKKAYYSVLLVGQSVVLCQYGLHTELFMVGLSSVLVVYGRLSHLSSPGSSLVALPMSHLLATS